MNLKQISAVLFLSMGIIACEDNETNGGNEGGQDSNQYYHIMYAEDAGGKYTQSVTKSQLESGTISFVKYGYQLTHAGTVDFSSSVDGKSVYGYIRTELLVRKFESNGGVAYDRGDAVSINPFIGGGEDVKWYFPINEVAGSVHTVTRVRVPEDINLPYEKYTATANIAVINLGDMTVGLSTAHQFEIPRSKGDADFNSFTTAIDGPLVLEDKIYYGMCRRRLKDDGSGGRDNAWDAPASMLVLDYPSFKNPEIIESGIKGTGNDTHGSYSIPSFVHPTDGHIYQVSLSESSIFRIKDGAYDDSYVFKLQTALGLSNEVEGFGIYHVSGDIAYAVFAERLPKTDGTDGTTRRWEIARLDLKNKTAIEMNITDDLDLWLMQKAEVIDGKLYMPITPITDGDGYICIFDPAIATADGFTKGATLKMSAGANYLGIF